jgi:SAM-dependent methyltransferase
MLEIDLPITGEDYVWQRWAPRAGDASYLHLSDLKLALQRFGSLDNLRVLDYGCGGSPYRGLFPHADFRRADVGAAGDLDYHLNHDGIISERSGFFDVILSTQVLEHVARPLAYLSEAHRLLKGGGRLICTTHGSFPDHGCPEDYRRWTARGLVADLEQAGFGQVEVLKVTTSSRAVLFFINEFLPDFAASRRTPFGLALWAARGLARASRVRIHRLADRHWPHCRVAGGDVASHRLYVGIVCVARRLPDT